MLNSVTSDTHKKHIITLNMEPMFKHQSLGFSTSPIDRTINHVKVKWITVAWNYSFNNVYVVSAYHLQNERGGRNTDIRNGNVESY